MSSGRSPAFFVPHCAPDEQETVFAGLAKVCDTTPVPGPGNRIYAISFRHDGDVWFATVGETLRGRRPVWKGRKKTETTVSIEDSAIVIAIFAASRNNLCWVYTDGGRGSRAPSKWANPFMAGELGLVDYFSE